MIQNNLEEWEDTRMTLWEQKVKHAYRQCNYLQKAIRAHANQLTTGTREQRMERAAERMEKKQAT